MGASQNHQNPDPHVQRSIGRIYGSSPVRHMPRARAAPIGRPPIARDTYRAERTIVSIRGQKFSIDAIRSGAGQKFYLKNLGPTTYSWLTYCPVAARMKPRLRLRRR